MAAGSGDVSSACAMTGAGGRGARGHSCHGEVVTAMGGLPGDPERQEEREVQHGRDIAK